MLLEIRDITKRFGTVLANDSVSLKMKSGEIIGLVGENGAGKSTLLSILGGFQQPDSGSVMIDGVPVRLRSTRDARSVGIGLVHQHRTLVPTFDVRKQLRLAGWDEHRIPDILGSDMPLSAIVGQLSPGQQQRVEIARELISNPAILLLDEPTSVLAPAEVETLFAALHAIRSTGATVVLVSHKLREVLSVASRVIVMAQARVQAEFVRSGAEWGSSIIPDVLACMFPDMPKPAMPAPQVGAVSRIASIDREPVLTAHDLRAVPETFGPPLRGLTFELFAGLVHVIVGVDGQGQGLLANVLAGYDKSEGTIELDGVPIERMSAIARAERGISLMSGDRTGIASIPVLTIAENLILKRPRGARVVGRFGLKRAGMNAVAHEAIRDWHIRPPDPSARTETLSGGNMQRVIAARDIPRGTRVLIVVNPVQGLDVRTSEFLWTRLRRHAVESGTAVLALISDIDEAMANADSIAVISGGAMTPFAPTDAWSYETIATQMVAG